MSVAVGEIIRIAARMIDANGSDNVNVYHMENAAGISETDAVVLQEVRDYLDAAYANMNSVLDGSYTPLDLKVDVVNIVGGVVNIVRNVGTITWGSTFNPNGSGESLPAGCCTLVLLRTLVGKVFGRKFIGGMLEVHGNGDIVSTAMQAAAVTFANAIVGGFVTAVGGSTFIPGIPSTKTGVFEAFTEALVSDVFAYQRRRKLGVGS